VVADGRPSGPGCSRSSNTSVCVSDVCSCVTCSLVIASRSSLVGWSRLPRAVVNTFVKHKRAHRRKLAILNRWQNKSEPFSAFVTNLSDRELSAAEMVVLGKGLSFVPTPKFCAGAVLQGFEDFANRLRVGVAAYVQKWAGRMHPFKAKSSYRIARSESVALERYIECTRRSLQMLTLCPSPVIKNFSGFEQSALRVLSQDRSIVIKKSDKGGNVVVVGAEVYKAEGLRQLNGPQYRVLEESSFSLDTNNMVLDWAERNFVSGNIDIMVRDFLQRIDGSKLKDATFYMLPKTHKNPPHTGRPIISGIGCPTERASALLQLFLSVVVRKQFTYIKDTRHFISQVEGQLLPASSVLITLDINNMYTEIPLDEAEIAVLDAVYQSGISVVHGVKLMPVGAFKSLLRICLTRNNIYFAGVQYLQVRGVPMGSKFSPEVADIVGFCLERRIFAMYDNTIRWVRFRDDCFMILPLDVSDVAAFVDTCNSAHETLKFKFESSKASVPFLDTEVTVASDGSLYVRPYRKPAYAFQYLYRNSAHPASVFKSFVKGELLRLARNSSRVQDFVLHADIFRSRLLARGYDDKFIEPVFSSVKYVEVRQSQSALNDHSPAAKLVCVFPYFPHLAPSTMRSALIDAWQYIVDDQILNTVFPTMPIVGLSKHCNLSKSLVSSRFD
jgi:hypothetical protein